MANKWKIRTISHCPEDKSQYEEVIEADNCMLDSTGQFLVFAKSLGITIPNPSGQGNSNVLNAIRFVNCKYLIEAYDITHSSKLLSN